MEFAVFSRKKPKKFFALCIFFFNSFNNKLAYAVSLRIFHLINVLDIYIYFVLITINMTDEQSDQSPKHRATWLI